jgi:hypothetical protein
LYIDIYLSVLNFDMNPHLQDMETHPGDMEAYHGAMETPPGDIEDHPGAMKAHPGGMGAGLVTVEVRNSSRCAYRLQSQLLCCQGEPPRLQREPLRLQDYITKL